MRHDPSARGREPPGVDRRSLFSRELATEPVADPLWSLRWMEALLQLPDVEPARLERGFAYAREGHVRELRLDDAKVKALVSGSRARPYEVSLRTAPLDDATWERVINAIRARPELASALLTGEPSEVPRSIDEVFRPLGVSLFPLRETDIVARCSCPDRASTCKHIGAVHCLLGAAFDRDPFLLFELRGRAKNQLLDALRSPPPLGGSTPGGATQGGASSPQGAAANATSGADAARAQPLAERLTEEAFDRARAPLGGLRFSIEEPAPRAAIIRSLGRPASWSRPEPIESWLDPTYQAAGKAALDLALSSVRASRRLIHRAR